MFARFLFCLMIFFLSASVAAQTNARFEASTDAKEVLLNGYVEVYFTLKNAEGNSFRPPVFKDFDVVSGPGRSSSTTIINGQVSKEMTYSFTLQPKRVGTFTIDPAIIQVKGKRLQTKPVSIKILKGKTNAEGVNAQQYFVRAEPSESDIVVGQQVVLIYKLYTTVDINSYNVISEPDYEGFFAQDLRGSFNYNKRQIVDGVQYYTQVIKRVTLFAQQAGNLEIGSMNMQLNVVTGESRGSGFFFNRRTRRVPAQTKAVNIKVRPLPSTPPEHFTGAVGNYKVAITLNKNVITTDDVLSLRITVTGGGDIKRVQAPELQFPDAFEAYDPKILDESTFNLNGVLNGKKEIEYLLVPTQAGSFELNPKFSYYNPDSSKFITAAKRFKVLVKQGSLRINPDLTNRGQDEVVEDIRFIKTQGRLGKKGDSFFGSIGFWVLSLLPLLLLAAAVAYKQLLKKKSNIDPALIKSRRARKLAEQRLATAENHMQASESKAFYDEVSKAMLGYVCDKLKIPVSELTKENVKEKLEELSVKTEDVDSFMQVIKTCEMALFAGMNNAGAMQETYERSVSILVDIEM